MQPVKCLSDREGLIRTCVTVEMQARNQRLEAGAAVSVMLCCVLPL